MSDAMTHGHDVVIPFRQMRQQSVDNLDWLVGQAHLGASMVERRVGLDDIFPHEQVRALETYVDALHRRAVYELVVRARRSAPKRRLR